MQKLLQEISHRCFLNPELQQRIENSFELKEAVQGEKILIQGNRANNLYFIEKGVLHNYYYHDGKQISSWFYKEDQFITSWYSFYARKQSFEEIECLEDCVLYQISYKEYQKLVADFPAFGNFARLLAEEMLTFIDEFSKGWSFLSAKEKYQLLLSYFPDVELRIKLGYIASFLGISQETLSRLRAKK
ncbi:Crp/Fnr family transcriptional regulator [Seonamhaeicola sp.]|uniref:Crp/Fnr family transcriptional regulator n=1 Tax=Seonamhaeicola sp. TaxID=1912245 RepID=UPI002606732B|nr:Crp/Fnr family transcriptional regulator [Seonamhaeicola sp.]